VLAPIVLAAASLATPALAADPTSDTGASTAATGVGEVMVTARKRTESLQRVPVAVTAIGGAQLAAQGIRSPLDLGLFVPSLTVTTMSAQATGAQFSLRGQAQGDGLLTSSQPVGIYEDAVNIPHPNGLTGSLFDLERVEVLKGPQGTLYGRNTTGGAINILSRNADYNGIHGFGSAEIGNHADWRIAGAVNLPIIQDVLAVRLAYQHWGRKGYMHDLTTGQYYGGDHNDDTFRLSIRFDPLPDLTTNTKVEYLRQWQNWGGAEKALFIGSSAEALAEDPVNGATRLAAQIADQDLFHGYGEGLLFDHNQVWHFSEDINWNIGNIKLRSITGYHSVFETYRNDIDSTSFQYLELDEPLLGPGGTVRPFQNPLHNDGPDPEYYSISQEFTVSGKLFNDRIDWLAGAYFSWEKGSGVHATETRGALSGALGTVFPAATFNNTGLDAISTISNGETTTTWAVYTQNDVHILDNLFVTLGLRYTHEAETNRAQPYNWNATAKAFACGVGFSAFLGPTSNPIADCGSVSSATQSNGLSYLISGNWQITPNALFYVKTARGFRGGALQYRFALAPPVGPELATDWEVGFKADFFQHRLRTNIAAYQTDYKNKQEAVIIATAAGSSTILVNAASARIRGLEGEFTVNPVPGFTINANVTYLAGEYLSYPCAIGSNPAVAAQSNNTACFAKGLANPAPSFYIDASGEKFADPKFRFSVSGRYAFDAGPGRVALEMDYAWRDRGFIAFRVLGFGFAAATGVPALHDALNQPVGLLNGHIDYTLQSPHLTFSVFATNLLDKHYILAGVASSALGTMNGFTQEPRMVGLSVRWGFGGGGE